MSPIALQTESAMHVHVAAPVAPVQLWCAPQATGLPYAKHPLLPIAQVASCPDTHAVCPCVQLSWHVREHAALGAMPEHDWGEGQGVVEAMKKQPLESLAQVATVWASLQIVPVCAHALALHAHATVPASPATQLWLVPQVVVVIHCGQPFAPNSHVCAPPEPHCIAPAVQESAHVGPSPASLVTAAASESALFDVESSGPSTPPSLTAPSLEAPDDPPVPVADSGLPVEDSGMSPELLPLPPPELDVDPSLASSWSSIENS
jgi:hypothetical protein